MRDQYVELFANAKCFATILADPPWQHDNFGQRKHGASKDVYDELPDEALAALPVEKISAENAVCVLWCTRTALAEGRGTALLIAWGFEPRTTAFVWHKVYRDGSPYCGLGSYTRSGTEVALLGIRGSCPRGELATNVREVITAPLEARPVGEDEHLDTHSSKPDVHDRIELLWPDLGPRVELFARRRRPGWQAWGAEAPACDLVFGPEVGAIWRPGVVA